MKDFKGLDELVDDLDHTPNGHGTIIGRSIRVSGEIIGEEFLTVEGEIEGKIELKNDLLIKKNGIIRADIIANGITVCGKVIGNINAKERIELKGDAKIIGDIRGPKIIIHEGAKIKGQIQMEFEMEEPKKNLEPPLNQVVIENQEQEDKTEPTEQAAANSAKETLETVKTETETRGGTIGLGHNISYQRIEEKKEEPPHYHQTERRPDEHRPRASFIVTKDRLNSNS